MISVALAIAAILLGLATPSIESLMRSSRMSATTNTLVYSLQSARSEAVKRSKPAGVCHSKNPMADDAQCDGPGYSAVRVMRVMRWCCRLRNVVQHLPFHQTMRLQRKCTLTTPVIASTLQPKCLCLARSELSMPSITRNVKSRFWPMVVSIR